MSNVLYCPPDWDSAPILAKLQHPGMRSSAWRREACRMDPLAFVLIYLRGHLRSPETMDMVSLSEFHIDLAESAKRWARTDIGPAEIRDAWVAPRGAGKSSWCFLGLPLWAMAYRWRRFTLAFAHAGPQARQHLLTLKMELATNELLRADFPELVAPAKRSGRHSAMDTQDSYLAENGCAFVVRGMDAATLGAKIGNVRPDLLIFDDVEADASNYSIGQKDKRLDSIRNAVMPMNVNAALLWAGTTVMFGSCVHDIVRGADWVLDERIECHHYPAIMTDPATGQERSLWKQRWDLDYLRSARVDRNGKLSHSYALNMDNAPVTADGTHWAEDDFVYDTDGSLAREVTSKVLCVDPAVTSSARSDATGLAVVGHAPERRKVLVERAVGIRRSPKEVEGIVHRMLKFDPLIREVVVETNQGGEYIIAALEPLPRGVRLVRAHASESKSSRITSLFYRYQAGDVTHSAPLVELQRQMCGWPHVANDDIIDACEAGVRHWLGKVAA